MNPDHPLYNTCKGKAICNKENERTQNCEFLGHESMSGQHDARIHYMLNQSVCDNRPTSDSKDIDYCTSRTQKGSPYVILSDSTLSYRDAQSACRSQGMDLATLTSNEERKELTRTIYQKLHDEKTTYVSCYGIYHISSTFCFVVVSCGTSDFYNVELVSLPIFAFVSSLYPQEYVSVPAVLDWTLANTSTFSL